MKKITPALLIAALAIFVIIIFCLQFVFASSFNKNKPDETAINSGVITLGEAGKQGVHLSKNSTLQGVSGWYEKNGYRIYFDAKQGGMNPWIERYFFSAPKYSALIIFRDNAGGQFIMAGGLENHEQLALQDVAPATSTADQLSAGRNMEMADEFSKIMQKLSANKNAQDLFDLVISIGNVSNEKGN